MAGAGKTSNIVFATPHNALPFQSEAQAPSRFFSWQVVKVKN
jgi:hypothetical protein